MRGLGIGCSCAIIVVSLEMTFPGTLRDVMLTVSGIAWLYCEPSYSLVELYQTLNYYQGWHSGLVRELTEIAFNIDAAGVLDGLRRGR